MSQGVGPGAADFEISVSTVSTTGDSSFLLPESFSKRLPELAHAIGSTTRSIVERVDWSGLVNSMGGQMGLDGVELSFGISLEAEAGIIVGKAKGASTFDIKVTLSKR